MKCKKITYVDEDGKEKILLGLVKETEDFFYVQTANFTHEIAKENMIDIIETNTQFRGGYEYD